MHREEGTAGAYLQCRGTMGRSGSVLISSRLNHLHLGTGMAFYTWPKGTVQLPKHRWDALVILLAFGGCLGQGGLWQVPYLLCLPAPPRRTQQQGFAKGMVLGQLNQAPGLHRLKWLLQILARINTFTCKCLNFSGFILNWTAPMVWLKVSQLDRAVWVTSHSNCCISLQSVIHTHAWKHVSSFGSGSCLTFFLVLGSSLLCKYSPWNQ